MSPAKKMTRTEKTEVLAHALAAGLSYVKAAEQAGLSRATVTRRMQEPGFRRRVEEVRRARLTGISDRLQSLGTEAADTLADLMRSAESEQVRARAALGLLGMLIRVRETVELEGQIAELQALLADDLDAHRREVRHAS